MYNVYVDYTFMWHYYKHEVTQYKIIYLWYYYELPVPATTSSVGNSVTARAGTCFARISTGGGSKQQLWSMQSMWRVKTHLVPYLFPSTRADAAATKRSSWRLCCFVSRATFGFMHRATHGVHWQDGEMRPNPVSLEGFTGIYVPFDQIVTSSTRLPNVVLDPVHSEYVGIPTLASSRIVGTLPPEKSDSE